MILEQTGAICEGLYSTGHHLLPAFLLTSPIPVLFDAGVAAMGPRYLKDIKRYLGRADALKYLLLTHSHYDHCGSIPFLKEKIPELQTGAHSHASQILEKPDVAEMMRALNRHFAKVFADVIGDEDIPFNAVKIDFLLKGGDELDFGEGWSVRVIETPGHTQDSLSFHIPKIKTVIAGEAAGVFHNDGINPQFSSSYRDYLSSLEKLAALDIDVLALGHGHILTGDDIGRFLKDSIETTVSFKKKIDDYLDLFNGEREKVVEAILRENYDETVLMQQDKRSFLLNLRAQVKVVAEGK